MKDGVGTGKSYKVHLVRDGSVPFTTKIRSPSRQAADLFRAFVGGSDREQPIAIFLDTQNRFLGLHTVSMARSTTAWSTRGRSSRRPSSATLPAWSSRTTTP